MLTSVTWKDGVLFAFLHMYLVQTGAKYVTIVILKALTFLEQLLYV